MSDERLRRELAAVWRRARWAGHGDSDAILPARLLGKYKVHVHSADHYVGQDVYCRGVFERQVSRLVQWYLQPGMIAFDVGANVGAHTVVMADAVGAEGRVHSFEPSEACTLLERNVSINDFTDRVKTNRAAVSDINANHWMYHCRTGLEASTSSWAPPESDWVRDRWFRTPATTLDDYLELHGIERVDLLKVDARGDEARVIGGARRAIADGKVDGIVLDLDRASQARSKTSPSELLEGLQRHSFRVCRIHQDGSWSDCDRVRSGRYDSAKIFAWRIW